VNGAVPPNELGSGTANNAACLHGDSTCGGGSGGGGGLTAGTLAIKYASDFAWSQNPTADLSIAGAKTVTLTTCPAGVTGTEQQYYVYDATLSISEARGNRQITDETKFREGLGKIVDGAVECLNASAWAHQKSRQ
jgi:hypothetical protein